jgi:C4-dicarboxylate-specific signal transduction histidine kinase
LKEIQKTYLWFFSAILLVGVVLTLIYSLYQQASVAKNQRSSTHVVIDTAQALLSAMIDAETGQRGYLLTGDEHFLQPYLAVSREFEHKLTGLTQLAQSIPDQQQRLTRLRLLAQARLAILEDTIVRYRSGDMEGAIAVVKLARSKALMDDFRLEISGLIQLEERILTEHEAVFNEKFHTLLALIGLLSGLAVLIALSGAYLIYRATRQHLTIQELSQKMLSDKNKALEALATKLREDDAQLVIHHRQAMEARERMVLIEKMSSLGTMVGGVAHEINNPLMGLMNYVEYAKDKSTECKTIEVLDMAMHEIERIRKIVQNMLIFVRVDNNAAARCNVAEAVQHTVNLLGGELQKHAIQLHIEIADNTVNIKCSASTLQQVLVNLLLNARDAVAEQTEKIITIRLHSDNGKITLSVCDNGTGVSPEVRHKIFVPFFTTKPVGKGTGLGLAVSRQLIEDAGGSLIYDENVKVGACFNVIIAQL